MRWPVGELPAGVLPAGGVSPPEAGGASTTYVTDFVAALPAPSVALTVNTCVPTPRSRPVAAAHVATPEPPASSQVNAAANAVPNG